MEDKFNTPILLGLARAFESKHGHLLLRGSSISSIEEPGQ